MTKLHNFQLYASPNEDLDEVTDRIIHRFFGIEPPHFAVATATLRLPSPSAEQAHSDVRRLRRRLRELTYHPERLLDASAPAESAQLVAEKQRWIGTAKTPTNALRRHLAINHVNQRLQPAVANLRSQCLEQLQEAEANLRAAEILGSRECAFCFFSQETLGDLYTVWPPSSE